MIFINQYDTQDHSIYRDTLTIKREHLRLSSPPHVVSLAQTLIKNKNYNLVTKE